LSPERDIMTVNIKFRELEKTITGSPDQVWQLLNKVFADFLPSFAIAAKLNLEVNLKDLIHDCQGLIAFTSEGPIVLASRSKLTDNETLTLLLLANYLGEKLGKIQQVGMSKEELQAKLGKPGKITSTRLGELVKNEIVAKTSDEKYRITTLGLVRLQKEILQRIKAKIGT
jgi:hypothetical protein